eukprot:m.12606 g.12606  ORF g.12606 m.12606 type:complete len:512 (-) comp2962_c0_seq1:315-1850(-)
MRDAWLCGQDTDPPSPTPSKHGPQGLTHYDAVPMHSVPCTVSPHNIQSSAHFSLGNGCRTGGNDGWAMVMGGAEGGAASAEEYAVPHDTRMKDAAAHPSSSRAVSPALHACSPFVEEAGEGSDDDATTPIHTLPDELLMDIFGMVGHPFLLVAAGRVCSRWRRLACVVRDIRLDLRFLRPSATLRRSIHVPAGATMLAAVACRFRCVVELCMAEWPALQDEVVVAVTRVCPLLASANFAMCQQLTDVSIVALANHCPLLHAVNVSCCGQITNESVVTLAKACPKITSVNFTMCKKLTDVSVVALAENCRHLTMIDLSWCAQLTTEATCALESHGTSLTSINFTAGKALIDPGVLDLVSVCTRLTAVDVSWCEDLSDDEVISIAEACPLLMEFNVTSCEELTDESIVVLAELCPLLHTLIVGYCILLTDASVVAVATHCRRTAVVDFSFCKAVTDAGVDALTLNCTQLERVDFTGCRGLTHASKEFLATRCPRLATVKGIIGWNAVMHAMTS